MEDEIITLHRTPILKSVDNAFKLLSCFTVENQNYTLIELARLKG
ncbi:MAG: hypothetical protein ACI8WT_001265 [Clostridium sp.]|jgi:hypothetical protein